MMTEDEQTAEITKLLRRIGCTMHVRGTDARTVVEFKDKRTGKIVGGSEFKRRVMALCK